MSARREDRETARQFWRALRPDERACVCDDLATFGRTDTLDWLDRFPDLPPRPSGAFWDAFLWCERLEAT